MTGHLNGLSVANQLLVFERILKCNHPSLGEGNKEKLMAFYILLLQYLQAVLQPQSLCSQTRFFSPILFIVVCLLDTRSWMRNIRIRDPG
jgi:hypothetical protein